MFRNSKGTYSGIPIIAANMDTVGTFEMALVLHQVWCSVPSGAITFLFEQCAEEDGDVSLSQH